MEAPRSRTVGTVALLALGINGIVGVGIFFAPTTLASLAGRTGSILVVVAVAVGLLPVAATFSVLGQRFPEDGGPVTFARAAFGDSIAFAVGWLAYTSALFSTAAVISGLAHALAPPSWPYTTLASVALTVTLAAIAALGIDVSKRAWSFVTAVKLVPLVVLAVVAVAVGASTSSNAASSAATPPVTSWARAALTACFAYQGFEIVPVIGGDTRDAKRAVPIAVVGSLAIAAVLYGILQWAFVAHVTDYSVDAPLVSAASVMGGPRLASVISAGTSISALGIAFGMIVTTPRYLSATARTGSLARMSARGVPMGALALTTVLACAVLLASSLSKLFALASLAVVLQYAVVAAALLALARKGRFELGPRHYAPALLTLATAAALLIGPERDEWISLGGVAALGLVVRFTLVRRRPRES